MISNLKVIVKHYLLLLKFYLFYYSKYEGSFFVKPKYLRSSFFSFESCYLLYFLCFGSIMFTHMLNHPWLWNFITLVLFTFRKIIDSSYTENAISLTKNIEYIKESIYP